MTVMLLMMIMNGSAPRPLAVARRIAACGFPLLRTAWATVMTVTIMSDNVPRARALTTAARGA